MQRSAQLDTATTPTGSRLPESLCTHRPTCPTADSPDREAARTIASHLEQGWSLLCNSVLVFEDTGELLPDGRIIDPHRPVGVMRAGLPFGRPDTHALIEGTVGSGTSDSAAFHKMATLANSSNTV